MSGAEMLEKRMRRITQAVDRIEKDRKNLLE
jgi:hypothetical protein